MASCGLTLSVIVALFVTVEMRRFRFQIPRHDAIFQQLSASPGVRYRTVLVLVFVHRRSAVNTRLTSNEPLSIVLSPLVDPQTAVSPTAVSAADHSSTFFFPFLNFPSLRE